jgi:hypothetical protein
MSPCSWRLKGPILALKVEVMATASWFEAKKVKNAATSSFAGCPGDRERRRKA